MRKSLLLGLFSCAVVFFISTSSAGAAELPVQVQEPVFSEETIERIVDVTETSKSPLLAIAEEQSIKQETSPVPVEQKVKHIVGASESLSNIATIFNVSWKRIYDKNTQITDPNVISEGQVLVIPKDEEVLTARTYTKPVEKVVARKPVANTSSPAAPAPRGSSSGNGYVYGYCTWYVKNRRPDMPNNLGNAATWVSRAAAQGMATGSTPAVGAVGQRGNHVVYVEAINGDGTITISDMNYKGWNQLTTRVVSASDFRYIY